MIYIVQRSSAFNTIAQWFNDVFIIFQSSHGITTQCTAIVFPNHHILRNIHQPTSQVTGIGCFQSRIGQTFSGTVCRDKVIQYIQSSFKVRENRIFNYLTAGTSALTGLSHQSTNTHELFNLCFTTTGSGIQHHKYRVESLLINRHFANQTFRNLHIHTTPDVNHLIVSFVIGD